MTKSLNWSYDEDTAYWAERVGNMVIPEKIVLHKEGTTQTPNSDTLHKRILEEKFPDYCYSINGNKIECNRENIIRCYCDGKVLEGLEIGRASCRERV